MRSSRSEAPRWLHIPPAVPTLALLLLVAAYLRPQLLSPFLLVLIVRQAVPLGLAVVGQTLVMRCLSIDLSIGGVVMVVAFLLTSEVLPLNAAGLVAICLAFGSAVGLLNAVFIVRWRASAVVVTLGMSMVLGGSVLAATQMYAPGEAPEALSEFARYRLLGVPAPGWVWLTASMLAAWVLRTTIFGRMVDAWGANPQAAKMSGLPGARVLAVAHVVSGFFSALSGCMLVAFVGVGSTNLGQDLAMGALSAAILGGVHFGGGKGGMVGPAVAAFMLTFLINFLTSLGLGEAGRLMMQGALLASAMMLYVRRGPATQKN